jgi:hypothetical protein
MQPNLAIDPYLTLSPRHMSPHKKHAYANQLDYDDHSVSIELQRSSYAKGNGGRAPNSEAHSYALADHPTGSHPLAPGPYHKANSRLRELLPQYNASVSVKTSWLHIFLTILALLTFAWYIGVRLWYLTSGKIADFKIQKVNIPYTWVVLAAELAATGLGFFGHPLYWKQHVKYTKLSDEELDDLVRVCTLLDMRRTRFSWYICHLRKRDGKKSEGIRKRKGKIDLFPFLEHLNRKYRKCISFFIFRFSFV